jgi:glycosyltransferase involved in cell wall biosynthesis
MSTNPPLLPPVRDVSKPPFWSVMIPTYRPKEQYLRETIESVLQHDIDPDEMQIEVIDDCSPDTDVACMVKSIAGDRVEFFRSTNNLGLAGCWNLCLAKSRGVYVHLLHQDDYVLPGFYPVLRRASENHPDIGLIATRSFFVDQDSVIISASRRLQELENGSRSAECFFYENPILCPGVVVKRSFYEVHGMFRSDLSYTLDYEMWVRAVSRMGGLVTSDVLSCHRIAGGSETGRLTKTAEDLKDCLRIAGIFQGNFENFDMARFHRTVAWRALQREEILKEKGDHAAATASHEVWHELTPLTRRWAFNARRVWSALSRRLLM